MEPKWFYLVYQMRALPKEEFQELPWRETPMAICGMFDDLELARACAHECATSEYVGVVDRLELNVSLGPEIVPKPEMRILNVDHLGDEWGPVAVLK